MPTRISFTVFKVQTETSFELFIIIHDTSDALAIKWTSMLIFKSKAGNFRAELESLARKMDLPNNGRCIITPHSNYTWISRILQAKYGEPESIRNLELMSPRFPVPMTYLQSAQLPRFLQPILEFEQQTPEFEQQTPEFEQQTPEFIETFSMSLESHPDITSSSAPAPTRHWDPPVGFPHMTQIFNLRDSWINLDEVIKK